MTTKTVPVRSTYIFLTEDGEHRNDYHEFAKASLKQKYGYSYHHKEWFVWQESASNGHGWEGIDADAIPEFIRGIALLMEGT